MFGLGGFSCRQGRASSAGLSLQRFLGAGEDEYSGIYSGKILQRDVEEDSEVLEGKRCEGKEGEGTT